MTPTLSPRARWWLVAGVVGVLVLTYLAGWAAYAYVRLPYVVRYEVAAPGAVVETSDATIGLRSMTVTTELADQRFGGDPSLSPPGASWVVAQVRVTTRVPDAVCDLQLIGPDRRRWEATTASGRTLPNYCGDDAVHTGQPATLELVYAVPDRYLDQLVGIGVFDGSTNARTQVLVP